VSRVGFPEGTWVACRVEEDKGTAGGCQVLGDRIVGDSQAGEDKVMAVQVGDREMAAMPEDREMAEDSQVGEDKVMAVQVGDREMAAMPEDREIAED
jgi:hypothetical protein